MPCSPKCYLLSVFSLDTKSHKLFRGFKHDVAPYSCCHPCFKSYADSFTLVIEQYTGEKGLSYIQFQKNRVKQFFAENRTMKLNIKAEELFRNMTKIPVKRLDSYKICQGQDLTYFDIYNEDDLVKPFKNLVKQILLGIECIELRASNFQFVKITTITITFPCDTYDPTRAGSYILLPEPIKTKKACINIQNEDNRCFKHIQILYSVSCIQKLWKEGLWRSCSLRFAKVHKSSSLGSLLVGSGLWNTN